jgi:nitric oxide dioxygenase
MNTLQKELIKATIPILKIGGELLTDHFYKRLFLHNPELKELFNMGNQANGKQKSALAMAVLAYAENIENPSVLISVLKGIGNKHISLNIEPAHYKIVGHHLIASIAEVIGEDATPDILEAWTIAYNQLAEIMINLEKEMYHKNELKQGGWKGWRSFKINKIVNESKEIKSFYLYPEDGKEIADFKAGQFISVQVYVNELELLQPRQYSLSSAYNPEYYRISVKKEIGNVSNPAGMVSNTLHTKSEGDVIKLSAPMGLFHLKENTNTPLVLISGGVGFTPMFSMLETNKSSIEKNKTIWIHGCRNKSVHAFKEELEVLNKDLSWLDTYVFYDDITEIESSEKILKGRVNLEVCKNEILLDKANYYICGPEEFIKTQYDSLIKFNVNKENIFYEEFGPQLINLN